jgi:hypothetical protein
MAQDEDPNVYSYILQDPALILTSLVSMHQRVELCVAKGIPISVLSVISEDVHLPKNVSHLHI